MGGEERMGRGRNGGEKVKEGRKEGKVECKEMEEAGEGRRGGGSERWNWAKRTREGRKGEGLRAEKGCLCVFKVAVGRRVLKRSGCLLPRRRPRREGKRRGRGGKGRGGENKQG